MNSNQSPSNNDARSGGRTGMGEKHPESGISPSLTSAGLCYLKLLVSNIVAGSIIGQKGATIANISSTTGCTIRLSHSSCYFPGTTERVVVMWGRLDQLKSAFRIMLEKIRDAPSTDGSTPTSTAITSSGSSKSDGRVMSKVVVPNSAVSQLIGKQGQTIKELQEATGTKIQISNRDEHHFKERVVIISGSFDHVCNASFSVMEAIQNDPHIKDHTEINYIITPPAVTSHVGHSNGLPPSTMMNSKSGIINSSAVGGYIPFFTQFEFPPNDNIGNRQPRLLPFDANAYRLSPGMPPSVGLTAHFDISDHFIGFVIGKQGATLQTIQQQSGAKLQVSGKGEFVPGTENRRVTISGSHSSVQMAHVLLQQKVREIENLTSQKSGYHALGSAPRNPGITSDSMHDHSRNNRLPFVIPSLIPNGNSGNPPMPYHPHHGHQHPYLSVRGGMQLSPSGQYHSGRSSPFPPSH